MIAASIYTDRRKDIHEKNEQLYAPTLGGSFGYSFILAWVAFAFTFISGLMYLILRKRKESPGAGWLSPRFRIHITVLYIISFFLCVVFLANTLFPLKAKRRVFMFLRSENRL